MLGVQQVKSVAGRPPPRRCGPFAPALLALQAARMRRPVNAMVDGVFPLNQGPAAIDKARQCGTLKVQLTMPEPPKTHTSPC